MIIKDYNLKVKNRLLIDIPYLEFETAVINNVLGSNGVGKTLFAKSVLGIYPFEGSIKVDGKVIAIGSYTNINGNLNIDDILFILKKKYSEENLSKLFNILKLQSIDSKLRVKNMSDGQKQKVKLFVFLQQRPEVLILDEFTNGLDKKSVIEISQFLKDYIQENNIVCINITHNLQDFENLAGNYYCISNQLIKALDDKETAISMYLKGEL